MNSELYKDDERVQRTMMPLAPEENYNDIFYLRVRINQKFKDVTGPAVTKMLGYTNAGDIRPEHIRILRLLDGPHGLTIYKMLCLKHGLAELGKSCADT